MSKSKLRDSETIQKHSIDQQSTAKVSISAAQVALTEDSFKDLQSKIQARLQSGKDKSAKKHNAGSTSKQLQHAHNGNRGKKRDAAGAVVDRPSASMNGDTSNEIDDDEQLRNALRELGGTNEDLQLIGNADSDSEMEGTNGAVVTDVRKSQGKSLEQGMANILKEIALAQGEVSNDSSSDEDDVEEEEVQEQILLPVKSGKKNLHPQLKCEPRADWYNITKSVVDTEKPIKYTLSSLTLERLEKYAHTLLMAENEVFKATQQSSSSQSFYNTVIASGTLSDKISALTLAVQESPLHNVRALESLVNLAGKRSRAQALEVLRALKDLFAQGSLLPGDRRLYTFGGQAALVAAFSQTKSWNMGDKLPRDISETDLICFRYESWLKEQYFEILRILEVWCNDEIDFAKQRAVSYVYELLKERPEQESNLLRLLINKLGDPVKKIASQTSYLIMQLLISHPAMKLVVISAIESDFIFRPGQSMTGKYYAAVTLNQTALSAREEDVAKKLLDIYFGLFTALLKSPADREEKDGKEVISQTRRQRQRKQKQPDLNLQGEELREKLTSAILTGVNRAYPYAGPDQKNFNEHLDTLFRITHSANFNTSIQAMLLIQQLTSTHAASADRFYRTLYESLLDPRLINASKQQLYLNLLHRALKADVNIKRVKAFIKRLLQILSLHDSPFVCGVFFLLKDLEKSMPALVALIDQPEDHDDDEEVFVDVDEDSNDADGTQRDRLTTAKHYNGHKRAPEHTNADNSCAWEVLPFLAHFHPSVSVSADRFVEHEKLPGKPDLTLHTLIHFLDRFVYRNPKLASNKMRGGSIMQPMASDDTHAVLISSTARQTQPAVNTDEFRNRKDDEVAVEDAFFHKYFSTLGKGTKTNKRKIHADDDSVGDEGEDVVWKAMMESAPDLEGNSSDDDLDMSDMSDFEAEMQDDGSEDVVDVDDADESDADIEAGIFDESDDDMLDVDVGEEEVESDFEGISEDDKAEDDTKKQHKNSRKDDRRKMKALPTFASAAEYAKMLEDDEDEDLG